MSLHEKKAAADAAFKAASQECAAEVQKMKVLRERQQALLSQVCVGSEANLQKSRDLHLLQQMIESQEHAIDSATAKKADKEGAARAAALALRPIAAEVAVGRAQEPPAKRMRGNVTIPLPSWTTGMIYSGSANYWCPRTHGWVKGYPHVADSSHMQRFILHLDSGNTADTCISRQAFEFLGLGSGQRLRQTCVCGVNNQRSTSDVYEIQFSIDLVNHALKLTNHIRKRTVEAAVINVPGKPGEVGYFDLLLSAADVRKFLNMELPNGAKLVLDVLDHAPRTLYDGVELCTRERFSARPPQHPPFRTPRPSPSLDFQSDLSLPGFDDDLFSDLFHSRRAHHASTACVLAVG
ncbi:unnamed protein product [Symbiodinium sp. CCMP2592]|nr:unnamed protein product [Symbiodinium sp. CCMP2592]